MVERGRRRRRIRGDAAGTEYCHRVRAFDAAGNVSEPSPEVCVRTGDPGSPGAPGSPRVESAGIGSVRLSWEPSPDAGVVYTVFWDKGQRIGVTRFSSYRVSGLRPGERRCFQVTATDLSGASSQKSWPVCAEIVATTAASNR